MRFYVSGVHSGPNPSPGVGVARSLRLAFPQADLVAVDYSNRSSGIHHGVFDEIQVFRPWNELDLETHRDQVQTLLGSDALWISGLDLEVEWLARHLPNEVGILVPPIESLKRLGKYTIPAEHSSFCSMVDSISAFQPQRALYAFCRQHDWRVWVKGPNYEAIRVNGWEELLKARSELHNRWSTSELSLQAHIEGSEECVAFSAYGGRLLDCVYMEKRVQTEEGKTWSGHIRDVDDVIREELGELVGYLKWTGGCEMEFVKGLDGILYLIDLNPRFPAWIFGSAIAGKNLPALLVETAQGVKGNRMPGLSTEFTRIVIEIPVRKGLPLPPVQHVPLGDEVASKHPSGMTFLAEKLRSSHLDRHKSKPLETARSIYSDLSRIDSTSLKTPALILLKDTADSTFRRIQGFANVAGNNGVRVVFAYSVKTNPHPYLMSMALRNGMLAEAISPQEIKHSMHMGFPPQRVVVNGPAGIQKGLTGSAPAYHAIFADSTEALHDLASRSPTPSRYIGLRVRPTGVESRFGIDLSDYPTFCEVSSILQGLGEEHRLGVHFHVPSGVLGVNRWWEIFESVISWAKALQESSERPVRCLDVGGGWFPEDYMGIFLPRLDWTLGRAKRALPELTQLILEPGKALAQPSMALVTRVSEVRRVANDRADVIVDGAISDLPMAEYFPHLAVACDSSGEWRVLSDGDDRILGRICMESDVLAVGVHIPYWMKPGDVIAFCDAGAYDASMSYDFGGGRIRGS